MSDIPDELDRASNGAGESPAAFEYVNKIPRMEAGSTIDGVEIPLLRGMLNADGTIAIKGEAAEQLRALIQHFPNEREPSMTTIRDFTDAIVAAEYKRRRGIWYDQQVPLEAFGYGCVRPGVSIEQAQAELEQLKADG